MDLIIGGMAQGKLGYALQKYALSLCDVTDGENCPLDAPPRTRLLNRMHCLTRRLLETGKDPEAFLGAFAARMPDAVILCDEIGCGVVPVGELERNWRECTGRLLCALARDAECVERICCGIPQVIKSGGTAWSLR